MAGSLNRVYILGRLGQDVKLSYTQGGQAVAEMSVATDESYTKDGQRVEAVAWHRVKAWGKLGENCAQYLAKGLGILVEGKLQTRTWEKDGQKHYVTEIIASGVQFVGKAPDAGQGASGGQGQGQGRPDGQNAGTGNPGANGGYSDPGPAFPSEAGAMDDVPFAWALIPMAGAVASLLSIPGVA